MGSSCESMAGDSWRAIDGGQFMAALCKPIPPLLDMRDYIEEFLTDIGREFLFLLL